MKSSIVTEGTAAVIVGENPGASKTTKADKLGIETIDEARLSGLLG